MKLGSGVVSVVLNYRLPNDTIRCVSSLQNSDFLDHHIIVVDNSAKETSKELVSALDPCVEVIATRDNLGFAGGSNVGIAAALERDADFVWLLNPDTVVEPNTLTGLVAASEKHPDGGIFGARILQGGSEPPRIWFNGGIINTGRFGATSHKDTGKLESEVSSTGVCETDYVTGASFFVRRSVLDATGLLPEDYFLYYEETDYCMRARARGWRILHVPESRLWHFKRSSGELPSAYYIYYMCRNRIHFSRRFFGATYEAAAADLGRFIRTWRRRIRANRPDLLDTFDQIVAMALEDALRKRFGRRNEIEGIALA